MISLWKSYMDIMQALKIGDPSEESSQLGPLISESSFNTMQMSSNL